jgi:hypothetical protein
VRGRITWLKLQRKAGYGLWRVQGTSGGVSQTESATAGVQESLSTVGGKQSGARLLAYMSRKRYRVRRGQAVCSRDCESDMVIAHRRHSHASETACSSPSGAAWRLLRPMMQVVCLRPSARVSRQALDGQRSHPQRRPESSQDDIDAHSARHGRPRTHLPPAGCARKHGEHYAPNHGRRRGHGRCAEHAPEAECRRHGHHHPLGRHNCAVWCVVGRCGRFCV